MIDAGEYDQKYREILWTFLKTYFDGGTHSFGGTARSFPDVDVAFDGPQFGVPITKPVIVAEPLDSLDERKQPSPQGGVLESFLQPVRFLVYTADPQSLWDTNSKIQNLLGLVMDGDPHAIGASGMRPWKIAQPVKLRWDPSQDMQVSQRIVVFRVDLQCGGVD